MPRAFVRYATPIVVLVALTVLPAVAAGQTQRVTGGGWIENVDYFDPTPNDPSTPDPTLPPDAEEAAVFAAGGNTKCTFGFVASCTPKETGGWEYDGELTFQDHYKGFKVKSLCIDYVKLDSQENTAVFCGEAEVRCGSKSMNTRFKVTVLDCSEPGRADTFQIELPLWTYPTDRCPYGAWGTLGGGNIQVHK
jgi:hypothetical protein